MQEKNANTLQKITCDYRFHSTSVWIPPHQFKILVFLIYIILIYIFIYFLYISLMGNQKSIFINAVDFKIVFSQFWHFNFFQREKVFHSFILSTNSWKFLSFKFFFVKSRERKDFLCSVKIYTKLLLRLAPMPSNTRHIHFREVTEKNSFAGNKYLQKYLFLCSLY